MEEKNMSPKLVIRYTAIVVGLVWSVAIAINGWHLNKTSLKLLGLVPLALALLFTIFDLYLWRIGPMLRVSKTPDLRGTWLGTYDSEWLDAKGKLQRSSGPVALVVKQTFTTTSIVLVADKSRSYSTLAQIQQQPSGEFNIDYFYSNTPKVKFRRELTNHAGSARLILGSVRPMKSTGEYWTDRLSRGSLELAWVSHQRVSELADAQALPKEPRKEVV